MKTFEEEWTAPVLKEVLREFESVDDAEYICLESSTFAGIWRQYQNDIRALAIESRITPSYMKVAMEGSSVLFSINYEGEDPPKTNFRKAVRIKFLKHEIERLESLQG